MTVTQQIDDTPSPLVVDETKADPTDPGPDLSRSTGTATAGAPTSAAPTTSTRPTFTITDAATACSVSRKTITRKLPELSTHGAAKDDDGVWRIPVEALLAVGLHPGRSLTPPVTAPPRRVVPAEHHEPQPRSGPDTVTVPRDRWDDLRIRLARAEAEAAERALALADARLALRALTAGPMGLGVVSEPTPAASPDTASDTWGRVATSPSPPARSSSAQPVGPIAVGPGQQTHPASMPTGPSPAAPQVTAEAVAGQTGPVGGETADPRPAERSGTEHEVMAARNLAARTGGYVPATAAPARKRRWWRSA